MARLDPLDDAEYARHRARQNNAAPDAYPPVGAATSELPAVAPAPVSPSAPQPPPSAYQETDDLPDLERELDAAAERRGRPPGGRRRAAHRSGRAGRNLPAAVGVGVGMGAIVLASLFLWRPAFLAVVGVAIVVGIWEMVRALRTSGANPPLIPLVGGGLTMAGLAWFGGPDALCLGLLVTVLAAMVWRLADGPADYQRDVTAIALVAVYVPFLGGFAVLLAAPDDGHWRVLVTLAAVVLSDTGGYLFGVLFGKHPMAPTVSPKKSWEGLAGSLVTTAIGSAVLLYVLFDIAPWWGAVFGVALSAAAVLGDLAESMLKRDLGIKDMSNLLPGHGGLMDRLDSVLFTVPAGYLLLALLT